MPLVFEEAARRHDWSPVCEADLVLDLPGTPWPPLVRRFLDTLPGERVPAVPVGRWPDGEASGSRDGVALFPAGGRDAEIDEVFRRIASASLPLDQVELACAARVPPSLVWEKAVRLGWPVTLSAGLPAAITRPGRLLLRFCDWVESGFESAELRRLLLSGDCWSKGFGADSWQQTARSCQQGEQLAASGEIDGQADLSPGQAARLLLKAEATWGRDTYGRALAHCAGEYERRAVDPEVSEEDRAWNARKGRQARTLRSWVIRVLDRVPSGEGKPQGRVALKEVLDAAIAFLSENAARWSRLDAVGLQAVTDALDDLRSLGEYDCSLANGLRFLRERVASRRVGRERPRPASGQA